MSEQEKRIVQEIQTQSSDDRARLMLSATPLCCNLWDEGFNNVDCNEEALRLFGLASKQEYLSRFSELSPSVQPDGSSSKEKMREMLGIAFRNGRGAFEWMHQQLNGDPIPVRVALVRVNIDSHKQIVLAYTRDLREIRANQARQKEADERTRIMLDATPLCCNFWDETFHNIDCNQAAVTLFGLSSKQEYLDRFFDLSPEYQPDGRLSSDKAIELITTAFREGRVVFEWMHQKLDGTPVPSEVTLVRVEMGNDKHVVIGYTRDLRELKASQAKQKEAAERTRIMLDTTPLCCNFWDENFNNIDCNQEAVNLFELKNKQEYLDRFFELSPEYQPDGCLTSEKALAMIQKAFREGRAVFEWMHQKLNGDQMPSEITLVRVDSFEGKSVVVGYTRDLREIKASQAKQREADERARLMLDFTPLCCTFWDEHLNILDCNQAALDLFELASKEEFFERFFELSPEYQPNGRLSLEALREMVPIAFRDGRIIFKWLHQTFSGKSLPSEVTLVRVDVGNGKNVVIGYTKDLRNVQN